jgi:hypothetical protein
VSGLLGGRIAEQTHHLIGLALSAAASLCPPMSISVKSRTAGGEAYEGHEDVVRRPGDCVASRLGGRLWT